MRIWRLNFLSITFKLDCCGSKICVADNFNHNKNITFKFAAAAATLVTDQVSVEYIINPIRKSKAEVIEQSILLHAQQSIYYTSSCRQSICNLNIHARSYYPWFLHPPCALLPIPPSVTMTNPGVILTAASFLLPSTKCSLSMISSSSASVQGAVSLIR